MRSRNFSFIFLLGLFQFKTGLCQTDSLANNSVVRSPVIFSVSYRLPVNNNILINSGHGLAFEVGINPAYFISKKQLIGIYGGIATRDNFWSTGFNGNFVNDYSNSVVSDVYWGLNMEAINASKQLFSEKKGTSLTFPGCETSSFHSAALYYGIIVRLPIPKYPLILKFYTGKNETSYRGGQIITEQKEYNYFAVKRQMHGCELSLFPGIKRSNKGHGFENISRIFLGTISVYYEYSDLSKAALYFTDGEKQISLPFRNYLSSSFLKKYKHENSFGIKLSVNIY
jgi:hypothetical protein